MPADNKSSLPFPPPPPTNLPVITVASAADNLFLPHLAALAASVLSKAAAGHFIDFFILCGNHEEKRKAAYTEKFASLQKLHPFARLSLVNAEKIIDPTEKVSPIFWRLALLTLPDRDKVLYLDSDMIVRGDLMPLWQTSFQGEQKIAAVPDIFFYLNAESGRNFIFAGKKHSYKDFALQELGLTDPVEYFNSGVILFNLKKCRSEKRRIDDDFAVLWQKCREKEIFLADQSILNRHFKGQVVYLPPAYNLFSRRMKRGQKRLLALKQEKLQKERQKALKNPLIVHFAGRAKPWLILNKHNRRFAKDYWTALQLTPFYQTIAEKYARQNHRTGFWFSFLKKHF